VADQSDGSTRLERMPTVLWRRTGRAVLLLPPRAEKPIWLTGTGVQLWESLSEPRTVDELARRLAREFAADPRQVVMDLEPVLAELVGIGAVRVGHAP
jgi:hypothetical protein